MPASQRNPVRAGSGTARAVTEASQSLDDPLQYLKGVGPQGAQLLGKLGLSTVGDLLRHFPRRWEDRTCFRRVADVQPGEWATVHGVVIAVTTRRPNTRLTVTEVLLDDAGNALKLVWFNQPYMEKVLHGLQAARRTIVAYGQVKRSGWATEIHNPEWEELSEDGDPLSANRIVPIYPATEGLRQGRLRRLIHAVLQSYLSCVEETLPAGILQKHRLMGAQEALRQIHFPDSEAELVAARRRLVFEEFFRL
ncbi:MAG: hypothetical protein NZ557_09860, partial [Chthonomonadaceae bacterium]|nr:hypothetical protein [Chthonomonadaceae bacterium]